MTQRIYVVSKIRYAPMWQAMVAMGLPIISSWINDGAEDQMNFTEAWPRYLAEASSATHVLVYMEPVDELKGGILEIGAALSSGATVVLIGGIPGAMRTAVHHPNILIATSIAQALEVIKEPKPVPDENDKAEDDANCIYCVGVVGVSKDSVAVTRERNSPRVHQRYHGVGVDVNPADYPCTAPQEIEPEPVRSIFDPPPVIYDKIRNYNDVPAGTVMRMKFDNIPNRGFNPNPGRADMDFQTSAPLFGEIGQGTATVRAVPQEMTYREAYRDHAVHTACENVVLPPQEMEVYAGEGAAPVNITDAASVEAYEKTYGSDPEIKAALRREDVLSMCQELEMSEAELAEHLQELDKAEDEGRGEAFIARLYGHSGKVIIRQGGVATLRTSDPNFHNRSTSTAPLQPFDEEN